MIAHHFGSVFVACPGEPTRFRRTNVEPHARGGGERQDACTYAIAIHVLDYLTSGPGNLTGEVRLLVCVFVIKPELLIFGRIEVKMSINQRRLCLSKRRDGRDNRGYAKCTEPCEKAASRPGWATISAV